MNADTEDYSATDILAARAIRDAQRALGKPVPQEVEYRAGLDPWAADRTQKHAENRRRWGHGPPSDRQVSELTELLHEVIGDQDRMDEQLDREWRERNQRSQD